MAVAAEKSRLFRCGRSLRDSTKSSEGRFRRPQNKLTIARRASCDGLTLKAKRYYDYFEVQAFFAAGFFAAAFFAAGFLAAAFFAAGFFAAAFLAAGFLAAAFLAAGFFAAAFTVVAFFTTFFVVAAFMGIAPLGWQIAR